jgi:hypothetical protein
VTLVQLLNAFTFEVFLWLTSKHPGLKNQVPVQLLFNHCRPDWITWKLKTLGSQIDQQIEQLHNSWDLQDQQTTAPIYSTKEADGSKAQELLGGELRLRSPWVKE